MKNFDQNNTQVAIIINGQKIVPPGWGLESARVALPTIIEGLKRAGIALIAHDGHGLPDWAI